MHGCELALCADRESPPTPKAGREARAGGRTDGLPHGG